MVTIIAKNQTASSITLENLGVTIPASGQFTLTNVLFASAILSDPELQDAVLAGDVILNDGVNDLSSVAVLDWARGSVGGVLVSPDDQESGTLLSKLVAGDNVTITEMTPGSVETLKIEVTDDAIAGSVFKQFGEDDTDSTTTENAFQQKLKMTTPSLESGKHLILYHAQLATSIGNGRFETRVQVDDTDTIASLTSSGGGSSGLGTTFAGHKVVDLAAGVHEVDIDYRKDAGGGDVVIRQARLAVWRWS